MMTSNVNFTAPVTTATIQTHFKKKQKENKKKNNEELGWFPPSLCCAATGHIFVCAEERVDAVALHGLVDKEQERRHDGQ